jgi:hypothetical protein
MEVCVCVCLLLQYLLQSCSRGGNNLVQIPCLSRRLLLMPRLYKVHAPRHITLL